MSKTREKMRLILLSAARGTEDEEVVTALVNLASEYDKIRHEAAVGALMPLAVLAERPDVDGKRLVEAIAEGDSASVAVLLAMSLAVSLARRGLAVCKRAASLRADIIADASARYTANAERPRGQGTGLSRLCSRQAFLNDALRERDMELLSEAEVRVYG